MPIHRLLTAAAAVSLIAGAAMAQAPATAPAAAPAPAAAAGAKLVPNGDLITTLRLAPQFTTFVKALDATNLSSLLQKERHWPLRCGGYSPTLKYSPCPTAGEMWGLFYIS